MIGGTVTERPEAIGASTICPVVRSIDEAITLASEEYAKIDLTLETQRTTSPKLVAN